MKDPAAHSRVLSSLRSVLVCPLCKGSLEVLVGVIACASCHLRIPQTRDDCLDLLPPQMTVPDLAGWNRRQVTMKRWYQDLLATPGDAAGCFEEDYRAYRRLFATLTGRVLDIGGGNGVARHYLTSAGCYVVLEPELDWLDGSWAGLADRFPCLAAPPWFIRGVGEHLPFSDGGFDAVLVLWALNHAADPAMVVGEAGRVLRPGGLLVLVLEDMPPRWLDLATPGFLDGRRAADIARLVVHKLRTSVMGRPWPIQSDHIPITEAELQAWSHEQFEIRRRRWAKGYLTLELIRRQTGGDSLTPGPP
jgi:SAM-dependent methyltransferase